MGWFVFWHFPWIWLKFGWLPKLGESWQAEGKWRCRYVTPPHLISISSQWLNSSSEYLVFHKHISSSWSTTCCYHPEKATTPPTSRVSIINTSKIYIIFLKTLYQSVAFIWTLTRTNIRIYSFQENDTNTLTWSPTKNILQRWTLDTSHKWCQGAPNEAALLSLSFAESLLTDRSSLLKTRETRETKVAALLD